VSTHSIPFQRRIRTHVVAETPTREWRRDLRDSLSPAYRSDAAHTMALIERRGAVGDTTHKGQLAGNWGWNLNVFLPSFEKHCWVAGSGSPSPTPASPDEKSIDTPREPTQEMHEYAVDATLLYKVRPTKQRKLFADTDRIVLGH
jgi:hypothetical protein